MHWEFLPKVIHNEGAIREYERAESKKLGRKIRRLTLVFLPVVIVIVWLFVHR